MFTAHRHACVTAAYSTERFHFSALTHDLIERNAAGEIIRSAFLQPKDSFQLADCLAEAERTHATMQEGIADMLMSQQLDRYVGPATVALTDQQPDATPNTDPTRSPVPCITGPAERREPRWTPDLFDPQESN